MSILCTLYLKDGIVLASETRATHSIEANGQRVITGQTDDLNKTFLITPHNVGVSFCDNAKFNNMIMEEYLRSDFIKTLTPDDNVVTIAQKFYDKLKGNHTQLIVSGYIGDLPYVYKTEQGLKLLNRNDNGVIYGMEVRGRYKKACDYFETYH